MKLKNVLISAALILAGFGTALGQVTIYSQDFETNLIGYSHTPSQTPASDPGDQYFHRAQPGDAAIYEGSVGPYTNVTGSWLFVGSNPNNFNSGNPGILTLGSGINVGSYTNLELSIDFGAVPNDWDATDDLSVEYSWDNSVWSTLYSFNSGATNSPLDLSGNAVGGTNTVNGTTLTYALQTIISTNFSGTGSTLYLRVVCDADANYEAFALNNVILTGTLANSNDTDTEILDPNTPISAKTIDPANFTNSSNTTDVFRFTIEDQGAPGDGLPTEVTQIRVQPASNNTADWTDHIQGVVVDDGSNFITPASAPTITDTEIIFPITSGDLTVTNGGSLDVTLAIYLNTSNIVDGAVLAFEIPQTGFNFTADATGSGFTSSLPAGAVVGNDITIDVDATELQFTTQPVGGVVSTVIPQVDIAYTDVNGNIDVDKSGTGFDIALTTTGTFDGSATTTVQANNGVAAFTNLVFNSTGTGLTLSATDQSTSIAGSYLSTTFDITAAPLVPTAGSIFITEIVDASNDFNAEYLELYNNTGNTLDLSSSKLIRVDAGSNSSEYVYDFGVNESSTSTGNADLTIPPYGFLIVARGATRTEFDTEFGTLDPAVSFNSGNSNNFFGTGRRWRLRTGGTADTDDGTLIDDTDGGVGSTRDIQNIFTGTFSTSGNSASANPGELDYLVYNGGAWVNSNAMDATTGSEDAYFYDDYTVGADEEINDLGVEAGVTFTIDPTNTLTVNGAIENNGTVVVENSGSIYQTAATDNNSGTGTYSIAREITAQDHLRFNFWSSPVSNAQMDVVFASSEPFDRYRFDASVTANSGYVNQQTGTLNPGQGYAVTPETQSPATTFNFTDTRTFTADLSNSESLNNGDVSYTMNGVSGDDFILLGNPYPSALDFDAFLSDHSSIINGTVYYWDASPVAIGNSDYATWNNTGANAVANSQKVAPTQNVPAMQGFMVQAQSATSGNQTFTYTNAMRVANENASIRFFKQETRERAWLALSSAAGKNQQLLGFMDEATDGFDPKYDGPIFKANQNHAFYSQNNQREYSIQALAKCAPGQSKTVPLGIDAWTTGTYTISLDSLNNWPSAHNLYLLDSARGVYTNLQQSNYSFVVNNTGAIQGRFYLKVGSSTVSLPEASQSGELNFYQREKALLVNDELSALGITQLSVLSLNGAKLQQVATNPQELQHQMNLAQLAPGVYVLQVRTEQGRVVNHKFYFH